MKRLKQFLALLRRLLGLTNNATRLAVTEISPDEQMKGNMPTYQLKTPIKPGFRRKLILTPDEKVDAQPDGRFARVSIESGDSTITYDEASTADRIQVWINGDGGLGSKSGRVKVDGRIGEGEIEIFQDIQWEVAHPDATEFSAVQEGEEEPIPAPAEPSFPSE